MKKEYNVCILGATGAVGQQMIQCLEEQSFPIKDLRLLASKRSVGRKFTCQGKEYTVQEATKDSFEGMDIVLGAVGNSLAKELLPYAVKAGAIVIDNSSAYRMDPECPLVVPEINPDDIFESNGIIANPNCATIIGLVAAYPLHLKAGLKSIVAATYQAVSGAGLHGITELDEQIDALKQGNPVQTETFPYQIAYNCIPQIGDFTDNGYSKEEMKMHNEGRKIMHIPDFLASCTCVRVPVYRCHSEALTLRFANPITPQEAREVLANAPGVKLVDDLANKQYPMPLDASDQDLVYVGRIRQDITDPTGHTLTLWCCGDQIRKGAATNAVQIAVRYIQGK